MQEYIVNAEPPSEKYCREKYFCFIIGISKVPLFDIHSSYSSKVIENFFSQKWEYKSF